MTDWLTLVRRHLSGRGVAVQAEVVDELAAHLAEAYDEAVARGASPSEAHARAVELLRGTDLSSLAASRATAGDRLTAAADVVDDHVSGWSDGPRRLLADLWRDGRYAVRMLGRAPLYAALAIGTVALGVGVTTTVFSLTNAVLLRPLPYPRAGSLVLLRSIQPPQEPSTQLAYLDVVDIAGTSSAFDAVTTIITTGPTLGGAEPLPLAGYSVTPAFFEMFGVRPALGRTFVAEEMRPGKGAVALISHALWQSRFSGRADAIGARITLDGAPHSIVGILPPGFHLDFPSADCDILLPLTSDHFLARSRAIFTFYGIARLRPGVSIDAANTTLDGIGRQLAAAYPETNKDRTFRVVPLRDEIVANVRPAILLLFGAVTLLLLVGCANLANLLLARASARRKEMAVRAALGAGSSRLVRQMLVESMILSLAGGAIGVSFAYWCVGLLAALPGISVPRIETVSVDGRVLLFALGLSLLTGLLFGLAPSLSTVGPRLASGLTDTARGSSGPVARRMRSALIVGEIAVALMLFAAAGLLAASFLKVLRVNPGYEADHALSLQLSLPGASYERWSQIVRFYDQLTASIGTLPQVKAAGVVSNLPLSGGSSGSALSIQGVPKAPTELPTIGWQYALPGYFRAMGIPILRGRDFTPADRDRKPHVTIVDATLARRFFPGQDPIGKRVYFGIPGEAEQDWHEIIGVVGEIRHFALDASPDPRAYDLYGQHGDLGATLVVRTYGDPTSVIPTLRARIRAIDPAVPVYAVRTLDELRALSLAPRRLILVLLGGFAALSLVLTMVGVYGVIAFVVGQRTREIGIRLALGARPRDVQTMLLGEGLRLAVIGVVVGLGGAIALRSTLASQLYGVTATDPMTLAIVTVLLLSAATLACYVPARRGTRVNPVEVLRAE